ASGKRVENFYRVKANREYGDFVFQPSTGKGIYYLYYLPFKNTGSWYFPNTVYPDYTDQYDSDWKQAHGITNTINADQFPVAKVLRFESINDFNSFYPMEIVATKEETKALIDQNANKDFLLFPEDRKNPIRMSTDIPQCWAVRKENEPFSGTALRNEFYAYQIGVFAAFKNLKNVKLIFSDLVKNDEQRIPAASIRCFNLKGIDWLGKAFTKEVNIEKGHVQPLWVGVDIKKNASPGVYTGTVTISADGVDKRLVNIQINIVDKIIENRGYDDLFRMARLNWLDSKIGLDDSVFKPYMPVELNQHIVKILGRTLHFDKYGLPDKITSSFTGSNDAINGVAKDIIVAPVQLVALRNGKELSWKST